MIQKIVLFLSLLICASGIQSSTQKQQPLDTVVYSTTMIIYNDLILLEGNIGNEKGYFVWDNGFSLAAVNANLDIQREKLLKNVVSGTDALGQQTDLEFYRIESMGVGNLKIDSLEVLEIDVSKVFPDADINILGFIGGNVINKYSWNFNFDESLAKLSTYNFVVDDATTIALDFTIDPQSNLHYMPITLNMLPEWALVDWGLNSHFDVKRTLAWLFLDSQHRYTIQGNSMNTVLGENTISEQTVLDNNYSIRIGEYEVPDKFRPEINLVDQSSYESVFGNLFFRENFNVIINMGQSKYYLSERKQKDLNFIPQSVNYGINLNKSTDDILRIGGIIKEHPGVIDAGLKPSDIVKSVNGLCAVDFRSQYELDQYLNTLKTKGKILVLELENGKKITLHLTDIWSVK